MRRNGPNRFFPDDVLVAWDEYVSSGNDAPEDLQSAIDGGRLENQAALLGVLQQNLNDIKCEKRPREQERTFKERQRTDKAMRDVVQGHLDVSSRWVPINIDRAVAAIERDYREDVDGMAQSIAQQIESGDIDDAEGLSEQITEDVDGSQRVTYTFQARLGMLVTTNPDAYADAYGDGEATIEQQMYAALQRDIVLELERMGYDMNDPQPLEREEEEEAE